MVLSTQMIRRMLLAAVFCVLTVLTASAQFDTRFWMPPIWNSSQNSHNQPSELFITTPSPTPVNVHIETADGTTWTFDGVVSAGNPLVVPLTVNLGQTTTPNAPITSQGLIVNSSQAIQCVHKISVNHNQTLVTLKGRNGRGTEFWAGSQVRNMNATYSPDEYHFISVMALEDNTVITFETPFNMFIQGSGNLPNPHTVTLNAKESYLIRGNNPIQHVAGSRISSDKEIVAISGSTHTRIAGGNAAEGGTDQLVPIGLTNTDFVVIKGDNIDPFDYAIIVATENNTEVYVDDNPNPVATINAGEYYDYTLTGGLGAPHYLRASKRAYCYHFTGASNDDEVGMSAIPQIECTGSRYIEFSRFQVNTTNQIMNITASPESAPTLMWNGVHYSDVPQAIVNPIPGLPGWLAITMPNAALQNNNIITSDGFFHAGFLTGTGATGTYGYLSGFNDAFEFLDPITGLPTTIYTAATLCQGETIDHCLHVFSCSDDHNIIDVEGNTGNVVVTPPTTPFDTCFNYTAPFNFAGGDTITFTVDNRFGFSGSVDVVFLVVDPQTPIDAGEFQELCGVTSGTLSAVDPDPLVQGTWSLVSGSGTIANPNSPTTSVTNLGLGQNVFQWAQDYGCQVNTSFTQINVYQGDPPTANAGEDVFLCSDDNAITLQGNDPGVTATGSWSIEQGAATIAGINNANASVSNIGVGENILSWNISNGPCAGDASNDSMSIFVYDVNHPAVQAGADQEICSSANNEVTLAASTPVFPATGEWIVLQGGGTFADINNPNTTVSDLTVGQHVFQWRVENGPCGVLSDEVTITVFDVDLQAAQAGNDLELCTPITSATLQASAPTGPATGTWSMTSGAGTFSNLNDPNATVTNLAIGTNVLRWTVTNGPCVPNETFDEITITVFDHTTDEASVGEDIQLCVTGAIDDVNLVADPAIFPATGQWPVISGGGILADPTDPNTLVSNLSMGVNEFQWTVNNGPCGAPSSALFTVTVFDDNLAPAFAGDDVSFCTPTSTYTMQAAATTAPAIGVWTLESGTGTISNVNNPNANISGLGIGANVFRWSIQNGPCPGKVDFDEVTIFIYDENAPIANAGGDQTICENPLSPNNIQLNANAAIFPATGQWSVISGSGNFSDVNDHQATVTGLSVGENIFEWTLDNGPCAQGVSSDQVSIFMFSAFQEQADAGANQQLCSDDPTTTLNGNALTFPATGQWVLTAGEGTIAEPSNPNTAVSGLGVGENTFEWTVNNGPCSNGITTDQMTITVFEGALSPANAGNDRVICSSTTSITLQGNAPIAPATGMWSVVSGSATFTNPAQHNTTVSGLGIGVNVLEWTVDNGVCSGETSDQMTVTVYDAQMPTAFAGEDQSLCLPQNGTNLDATAPIFPATGQWTLISGMGDIADASDPNSGVTGLSVGLNTFRWTVTNGPCAPATSLDQVNIYVFDNNQSISAGPDQSVCTPVTSASLSATPAIFPATGQWTLVSGSGSISNPSSPTSSVTGLGFGENVFQWTINNGSCDPGVLTDTVTITLYNDAQADANAGADVDICTPQSTVSLSGNAVNFPATGLWTLVSGSAVIDDPTNPNTTVSNLTVGTVVLQWTITNGPCNPPNSSDQVVIRIFDGTADVADAGADLEFCQPAGVVTLSANAPVSPATGQWTLISGSANIANPSNPTTTVSSIGVGNNVFQWSINNGVCGAPSSDTMTISVFSPNAPVANAGSDQNLCTPNNFTDLAGNKPQIPGTGVWTMVSGSGDILDPSNPSSPIENLGIGENIFQWTIENGPCGSTSDQVSIFVFDGGAPQANAGEDQELCTPVNSTFMNASLALDPGVGTWTLVNGSGSIADLNDPNTEITNLGVGINIFAWTLDYSTCGVQEDFVTIIVYDATIPAANAGGDQEICTPNDAVTLAATGVSLPAIGTWTLVSGSGEIVNPNIPNTTVENLGLGENVFQWMVYNGSCLAPEDQTDLVSIFVYNENVANAHAGDDQQICTPDDSVQLNGSTINGAATGLWTLVSGSGVIADPSNPQSAVTGLTVGENIFQWTVDNGPCANGITSDTVSIFVFDENQASADAGADQEHCTPLSSITLEGNAATFPAQGTWTLISGSGTIAQPNNPNSAVTGLSPGENIFRWRIENGPCGSFTQDFVSIFVYNQFNADANAGTDQELCAPNFSTQLDGNSPLAPAAGTWTLFSGSGVIANPTNPNSLVSDLAIGENIFVWTVDNGPCANGITTDTVSVFVFDPAADIAFAGDDLILCTPETFATMGANTAAIPGLGTWTLTQGTATIADIHDPNTEITDLGIG